LIETDFSFSIVFQEHLHLPESLINQSLMAFGLSSSVEDFWIWCHKPEQQQQPRPPEQREPIGSQLQWNHTSS